MLAATPDIIPHTLLRVVRVFLARHPHIHLTIRSATRNEVTGMVSEGEADIGIIQHYDRNETFEFEGLFAYERVLITPLDHPLSKEPLVFAGADSALPADTDERGDGTRATCWNPN